MKDTILQVNNYSLTEVEKGKSELLKYTNNALNNNLIFKKAYKATYDKDYSYLSLKRSKLVKCWCMNAMFNSAILTGSDFQHTTFSNCEFLNASFDFCLFYGCELTSNDSSKAISGANFSNTNIVNSRLVNILFDRSTITNTLFEHTIIDHCSIKYSSFENSTFNDCYFSNMELRNLNIEFVEFKNCKFEKVILPFAQIPYTFGLLDCIKRFKDSVWISSKNENQTMTIEEYIGILPQLVPYYIHEQEYFPATNIYIFFKEYDKAFDSLMCGIKKACMEKDFRMLKYFCKLAITSGWCDRNKIKKLFDFISEIKNFEPMTEYAQHNYYLHLGDLRKILFFGAETMPTLHFHLQTNISPGEEDKLIALVKCIDNIINASEDDKVIHSIEMHHESPYDLLILAVGLAVILKAIAEGIHSLCSPVKDLQEIRKNQQQITLNQQEIVMNKEKIRKMKEVAEEAKETMCINNITMQGQFYFTNYESPKLVNRR